MEKKTLYSREDFEKWYHDSPKYVRKHATNEDEPNKYPCVVSWKTIYGNIHEVDNMFYNFIYIDDFV